MGRPGSAGESEDAPPVIYDLHSHTYLCKHAAVVLPRQYHAMAAAQNMRGFAFCCHNPFPGDDYEAWSRMSYAELPAFLKLYASESEYCARRFPQLELTLNMETDWVPGQEDRVRAFVRDSLVGFDCVLGSLHGYSDVGKPIPDKLAYVDAYYKNWLNAVRSGCFQVMTHMDYWRVVTGGPWAVRNRAKVVPIIRAALRALADENEARAARGEDPISVEINTGGLQYDTEMFLPAEYVIEMAADLQIPLCLSSDCHEPGEVGRHFQEALALVKRLGVPTLSYYRKKRMFTYSTEASLASYRVIDADAVLRSVQEDPELAEEVQWRGSRGR